MIFYDSVQSAHEKFFTGVLFTSYILIFVSFFGLSNSAPEYLATLDYYIRNGFKKENMQTSLNSGDNKNFLTITQLKRIIG